jgi:hypothetical protein
MNCDHGLTYFQSLHETEGMLRNEEQWLFHHKAFYIYLRLCPSSGIIKARKHNVSETESVSVVRWGGRHILCWVPQKELTRHSMCLPPHLRMERDPVSETLCFPKSENPVMLSVIHDRENPLESTFHIVNSNHCTIISVHIKSAGPHASIIKEKTVIPAPWNMNWSSGDRS